MGNGGADIGGPVSSVIPPLLQAKSKGKCALAWRCVEKGAVKGCALRH